LAGRWSASSVGNDGEKFSSQRQGLPFSQRNRYFERWGKNVLLRWNFMPELEENARCVTVDEDVVSVLQTKVYLDINPDQIGHPYNGRINT
jgi:hypothetical protein